MAELISLREAARRLGVSDTAVRKAIKSGRVSIAGRHETNGRPLVNYDQVLAGWTANTDPSMQRKPTTDEPRAGMLQPTAKVGVADQPPADEAPKGGAPNYNTSRAVRETYAARLLKLEYEERIGKLVPIQDVASAVESEYSRVRARLLGIASKLAPDVALTDDEGKCRALIEAAIVDALKELTADTTMQQKAAS